jgi:hypothetical protein
LLPNFNLYHYSVGGISLKPAAGDSVHDVIFRAYKTPQNVNADREDAVRVVRWGCTS